MLILEKFRNKYHQIWITVDGEKRDTKFDYRLKGESKLFFIRTDLAPPLHWRRWLVYPDRLCGRAGYDYLFLYRLLTLTHEPDTIFSELKLAFLK
jgi:hypothetical protein